MCNRHTLAENRNSLTLNRTQGKGRSHRRRRKNAWAESRLAALCAVWIAFTTCGAGPQSRSVAKSKPDYVRFSKPDALTLGELVQLEKQANPPAFLAKKLHKLVTTSFISNEAFYNGAQPKRPSSAELGPYLRAVMWNIERGIQLDEIRIALTQAGKFDSLLSDGKVPVLLCESNLRYRA